MPGEKSGDGLFEAWDEQIKRQRENAGGDERAFFIRRVHAASYLVPRAPDGKGLALLATQGGEMFLPAFTSEDEFGKWTGPSGGATLLPFETLHGIVVDDPKLHGVVINPFGPVLLLRRADLAATENAATGMTHRRVDHAGGRMIVEAARYPASLARAFADALKKRPEDISEAYILTARQEHEPKPHLLFLIDFSGDRKLLFPPIAKALQPHMKHGTEFELLKASTPLLRIARQKAQPVFRK
jgi:hypothetical protein